MGNCNSCCVRGGVIYIRFEAQIMYYLISLAKQNNRGDISVRYVYQKSDTFDTVLDYINKQNQLLIDGYEVMAVVEVSKEEYERNSA